MTDPDPIRTTGPYEDDTGRWWLVTLTWAEVGGRLEVVGIEVTSHVTPDQRRDLDVADEQPIEVRRLDAATLRSVPLGALAKLHRDDLTTSDEPWANATTAGVTLDGVSADEFAAATKRTGRGGRPSYDRAHWEQVAAVYVSAWLGGDPPTRAVAETFTISPSTAAKWVQRCRAEGLLAPTTKGKAGGVPAEEDHR